MNHVSIKSLLLTVSLMHTGLHASTIVPSQEAATLESLEKTALLEEKLQEISNVLKVALASEPTSFKQHAKETTKEIAQEIVLLAGSFGIGKGSVAMLTRGNRFTKEITTAGVSYILLKLISRLVFRSKNTISHALSPINEITSLIDTNIKNLNNAQRTTLKQKFTELEATLEANLALHTQTNLKKSGSLVSSSAQDLFRIIKSTTFGIALTRLLYDDFTLTSMACGTGVISSTYTLLKLIEQQPNLNEKNIYQALHALHQAEKLLATES